MVSKSFLTNTQVFEHIENPILNKNVTQKNKLEKGV